VRLGMLLGLLFSAMVILAWGGKTPMNPPARGPRHGPILSDCDGRIQELVIHYVPLASAIVETVYREFLRELPEDVTVHVACPDRAAFEDLRTRINPVRCRLNPVFTGHPMTCWSRDRWLAMAPERPGQPILLLSPKDESGASVWSERKGDARIGKDLAVTMDGVASHRSVLSFDGGDFVADAHAVFVTPRVLARNPGVTVRADSDLERQIATILKRKIILLPEAPEHHAGMFMMLAGNRRAIVGDPSMARGMQTPLENPDFSDATQRLFDAVAECCAANGYDVVRIPVVPGQDGRTYMTSLNVILDQRDSERIVYMPVYRQAESLNRAASAIWQGLGYEVRTVDCTDAYPHFGSLRCLVNVLRRADATSAQ